ncbi:MAG TPA: primase-helicase family protein, partial [Gemmatimonadaceae bacterium]|nr:primase-helicase family protein [Gemmatimonadaceae bacterium]
GKSVAVSKLWMEHPKRRQFEIEVFDPTQPPLTGVPSRVDGAQDFNAWPGFAVSPTREGSCQLFLDHLRDVVSCGNEEVYEWVIMWLAAMVQKPHELPGTALVLRGAQGTGKSLSGEILGAMLGDRLYTIVSGSEELTGRFNVQLARRLLIQVEEAFFAANRGIVGRLKNMITSPLMRVERKGIDPFEIPNCARLLITSNESWVVPAEEGERRFMVLDVSDAHKNDHAYFGALRRQMLDEAGTSRLLEHLLHEVHVKDDVIRRPLATDALRDQQLRSMAPERRWFLDVLAEGVLPGDDRGKGVALFDDLYTSYVHSARDYHGGTRTLDKVAFGRFLIECGATKYRPRSQGRASMRRFPPLHQCRATFARGLATTPDWEEAADWQAGCEVLGGVA